MASYKSHVEVLKLLLEKGADVTVVNKNRWTPLYVASDSGAAREGRRCDGYK